MDILSVLLRQRSRAIGTVIPDVVVTEKHSDTLEITEHPVEKGAAVSDHAYRRPSEVVMEIGFSGGGSLLDFLDTSSVGLSLGQSPTEIYQELLSLQESRVPIDVVTGKRLYSNMLIKGLEVTTDQKSENVLMATVTLREVIITSTQQVQVAEKQNMTQGVNTSAVQNSGTKSTKSADQSLLSSIFG